MSARGAAWSDGDAAVERERAVKELKPGHVRLAVFVGGGLDALDRYNVASAEELAELDAAFALGGQVAVIELVKGKLASAEELAELDAAFALGGQVAVIELVKGKLT